MFNKKAFEEYMKISEQLSLDDNGFDLYAQPVETFAFLTEIIPTLIVSSAGGAMPFQAEGLIQGLPFYYRERHETASLAVGEKDGSPFGDSVLYAASLESDYAWNGEKFPETLIKLVGMLKKAKFWYKFEGLETIFPGKNGDWSWVLTDKKESLNTGAWGNTPEEAYKTAMEPSQYLVGCGFTVEKQKELKIAQKINPTPVNEDQRFYPDPEPVFAINLPDSWEFTI